jgi:glucose-6-phosphate dehydrogenase assembly protein OpcA
MGGNAASAGPAPAGFLTGRPIAVDPERIERELARMWKPVDAEGAEGPATRACLSNLVIDLPGAAACPRARDLLVALGRRFPSRMIILVRRSGEAPPRLSASVTAVCHRPAAGAPPVCCEQIILDSAGDRLDIIRGAVLPLLVPDVPVILVLSGVEGRPVAAVLAELADRAVFDSRPAAPSDLSAITEVLEGRPSLAVDDMAWRATAGMRRAISDIFDDPAARPLLRELRSVEVRYAPLAGAGAAGKGAAAAAFLAGWLLSRLGWRFEARFDASGGLGSILARDGRAVRVVLQPREGGPAGEIASLRLEARIGGREARLEASSAAGILRIEAEAGDLCVVPRTMALGARSDADLLGEALEHTTHQGIFRGALELARRFG